MAIKQTKLDLEKLLLRRRQNIEQYIASVVHSEQDLNNLKNEFILSDNILKIAEKYCKKTNNDFVDVVSDNNVDNIIVEPEETSSVVEHNDENLNLLNDDNEKAEPSKPKTKSNKTKK